jgi:hypothetical protein
MRLVILAEEPITSWIFLSFNKGTKWTSKEKTKVEYEHEYVGIYSRKFLLSIVCRSNVEVSYRDIMNMHC